MANDDIFDVAIVGGGPAGLSAAILSNVSLNATVAGTVRKRQGNETSAQIGLRAAF